MYLLFLNQHYYFSNRWRLRNAIFILDGGGSHTPLHTNPFGFTGKLYLAHWRPENEKKVISLFISLNFSPGWFINFNYLPPLASLLHVALLHFLVRKWQYSPHGQSLLFLHSESELRSSFLHRHIPLFISLGERVLSFFTLGFLPLQ